MKRRKKKKKKDPGSPISEYFPENSPGLLHYVYDSRGAALLCEFIKKKIIHSMAGSEQGKSYSSGIMEIHNAAEHSILIGRVLIF